MTVAERSKPSDEVDIAGSGTELADPWNTLFATDTADFESSPAAAAVATAVPSAEEPGIVVPQRDAARMSRVAYQG